MDLWMNKWMEMMDGCLYLWSDELMVGWMDGWVDE
jgi:hypothetical protein